MSLHKLKTVSKQDQKTSGALPVIGKTDKVKATFITDGFKAWNKMTDPIKSCESKFYVKKLIKKFVGTLTI